MASPRALVIDDEQIVLDSVSKILEEDGYAVETTLSGREGIDLALEREYEVVLTDIRMPDIGGMRVLRDVRRIKPKLPVVMITAYATVKSAVQAMKLGANDYLEKPFTPEQLVTAVKNAIRNARTAPEDPDLVHKDTILEVLERAATDPEFVSSLYYQGVEALDDYELTKAEKLALLTGDVAWIESRVGHLSSLQLRWLEQRLSAEIW
jgi:DNA-binding NtrC family response regulator